MLQGVTKWSLGFAVISSVAIVTVSHYYLYSWIRKVLWTLFTCLIFSPTNGDNLVVCTKQGGVLPPEAQIIMPFYGVRRTYGVP